MPRQDVPYPGGALCRLKCQINELWQAVRNKLHSINGVPGDGNGDVKILAGQNVQIVNDQVHNEITISATGGSAEDVVKSVNGELPDQDGDVVIDTGVMTVNSVSPDSDGEITITAGSNITITPDADTNSIEIAASGGGPWTEDTTYHWAYLVDGNGKTTKEIIIWKQPGSNYSEEMVYIPKGITVSGYTIMMEYLHIDGTIGISKVDLANLLIDFVSQWSNVTIIQSTMSTYQSGNGIDQIVYLTKNFGQTSVTANTFHIYTR